jgi:hypothetical protein
MRIGVADRGIPQCAALERWDIDKPMNLRASPIDGPAMRWPRPFPFYIDHLEVDGQIAVWRPMSPDSMVLQTLEPESRDVLVAVIEGYVGCRRGGCA